MSDNRHRLERFDTAACSIKPWRDSRPDQTARRDGEVLDVKGLQAVTFSLNRREYTHTFLVCSHPTEAAGLLGTDFLEKSGAVIDFECGKMSLTDSGRAPQVYSVAPAKHTALTVFTGGKAGRSPQLKQQETRQVDEQLSAGLTSETVTQTSKIWLV